MTNRVFLIYRKYSLDSPSNYVENIRKNDEFLLQNLFWSILFCLWKPDSFRRLKINAAEHILCNKYTNNGKWFKIWFKESFFGHITCTREQILKWRDDKLTSWTKRFTFYTLIMGILNQVTSSIIFRWVVLRSIFNYPCLLKMVLFCMQAGYRSACSWFCATFDFLVVIIQCFPIYFYQNTDHKIFQIEILAALPLQISKYECF